MKNLEFRQISNNFQGKLKNDIEHIKKSNEVFIFADKSRNIYEVELEKYKKLLKENMTKNYNRSNVTRQYIIEIKTPRKLQRKYQIWTG